MILTLTPNPSVDRAYDLPELGLGEVNRAEAVHLDAGGKGINVSRALVANATPSLAILPVGGADGDLLITLLGPTGVATKAVAMPGDTRSNITLQDASGRTTKVNAPGPVLDSHAQASLLGAVASAVSAGDIVVGAGSLPRGTTDEFYVELGQVVRQRGAEFVLDTSGPAFNAAVATGGLALVKPNDEELAELVGRELPTVGDVTAAAREIIAAGTQAVLVSLGSHGAMLVTATGSVWAGGPALIPASTVGAGDTTLAGYLAASGGNLASADPARCLQTAVAWGRAAVMLPGTAVPTPDLIDADAVRVIPEPDPTTEIKEL